MQLFNILIVLMFKGWSLFGVGRGEVGVIVTMKEMIGTLQEYMVPHTQLCIQKRQHNQICISSPNQRPLTFFEKMLPL